MITYTLIETSSVSGAAKKHPQDPAIIVTYQKVILASISPTGPIQM